MNHSGTISEKTSPVYKYLEYLPSQYGSLPKKLWPLILFLHGAGERGDDLEKVRTVGLFPAIEKSPIPFVVLGPQCQFNQTWAVKDLEIFLAYCIKQYRIDQCRLYCTGISMGGYATWYLAVHLQGTFAAITPICGGGSIVQAKKIRDLPVWAFHGAKDKVVPPERSKRMVDELKRIGGNVKYTVYADAEHDSWTKTYSNPELFKWFLQHKSGH